MRFVLICRPAFANPPGLAPGPTRTGPRARRPRSNSANSANSVGSANSATAPYSPYAPALAHKKTLSGVQNMPKHAQNTSLRPIWTCSREILCKLSQKSAKFSIHTHC